MLAVSEWKTVVTMFHNLLVRGFFPLLFLSLLFLSNLAFPYFSDHRPGILSNEKVLHSQFHMDSSGMWALAPSAMKYVEYVLLL